MSELTSKQEDFMIESGMEDLREDKDDEEIDWEDYPERDESVWADDPEDEDGL